MGIFAAGQNTTYNLTWTSKTLTKNFSRDKTSSFLARDEANFAHSVAALGAENGRQAWPLAFLYSRILPMSYRFPLVTAGAKFCEDTDLFHISMWRDSRIHTLK